MNPAPVGINQILGGLAQMSRTSLVRTAIKHWWITAPLGFAAYSILHQRYKKGELNLPNALTDLAPMVTLVATLVILNSTLEQSEQAAGTAPAAPRPPLGPIRDASFTPTPAQNQPIPAVPVSGDFA